ncbi:MAG: dTMP kinase [Candidatus Methylumidiphilus sp.]
MKKGLFIVFEGIDGSGTSTQAIMLRDRLSANGYAVTLTSEPSEGPIGNMIRQGMKGRLQFSSNPMLFDKQMAYLFAADRHDHLHNDVDGVIKLTGKGNHVISTRYFFSSYAYHSDSGDSLAFVKKLNEAFPKPDLVIYLRNSVECSIQRMANRAHKDAYENEQKLTKVGRNYDDIFSEYDGSLIILDAKDEPDVIHYNIYNQVRKLL